ncbi:hypothetical protein E3N88_13477 [Mikania micrantha]|uniref:Uncharacterized protein n=1 Tax=Mikania micrantha TaxID=192012 RepID=A0A5N6P9R8_9ASTR|nr:hypothetical protein E3N88_13477 [Mikania micrantha]
MPLIPYLIHRLVFLFVLLLLCVGSFVSGGLTSGSKEDANMTGTKSCNDNERRALLDFKANLVDINNSLHDWGKKEKDCCQWVGVTCNNQNGHVTELRLSTASNGLSGKMSPLLPLLSQLKYLDLSGINFQLNPIPSSLSSLTSLHHLQISGANLSGSIPHQLANLSNLLRLNLSSNLLSGWIPVSFGNLTSLTHLDLSRSGLTGTLPHSVGKLLNLEYLDVSSNSLNGSISDVHFLNLSQLTYLDLSFNSFELNLSSNAKFSFKLNAIIKMQSCKLGPSFPMWIQTQRDFAYLDISNAGISDIIPGWFWDLPPGLTHLNLSSNEIRGMLNMTSVFESYPGMDLSYNQLEGTVQVLPSKLAALNLSGNKFSGTLSFLCQIDKSLTFLDLSNNFFSGSLPDCLQKFQKNLVVLNLSNNSLSGEIPSSLGSLSKLQALYLRKNAFVGEIPASLSNCTELRFVDLGENKLSGNIPTWIGRTLSELYALVIRSNKLEGSLPPQMCLLNNLQFLDLSDNGLSGNIPRCFGNFTAMATRGFQDDIVSHSYSSYEETVSSGIISCDKLSCLRRYYVSSSGPYALFIDNALVAWKGTRREFGRDDEDVDELWKSYYMGMGSGFGVGFLGICGALFLNRRCRYFVFVSLNNVKDWIYVIVAVYFQNLHRKLNR